MKILYITDLLSPYRVEWMNMLSKKCEINTYFFDEHEKTREKDWLNSINCQFKTHHVKNTIIGGVRLSSEIFEVLKKTDADVFIVDGYSSLIQVQVIRWLVKRQKNVFVNVDGIDVWRKETYASKIKGLIKNYVYRSGAKFLCGSRIAAERIIQLGAEKDKVFVHPFTSLHESDIITFEEKIQHQNEFKNKIGSVDKMVAVAVGRFIPLKRYEILIQAWKDMPDDCVLFLIGGGELRPEYERLIKELSVQNITIIDYLNKEKLNEYYMAADLFVHTSETEVWGLVFNEAMAKGCPVISTNHCVGGVELIRDYEEGFIVEVGNPKELHDRMIAILVSDSLKQSMMEKSIDRIRSYTYENLVHIHYQVFEGSLYDG